jgi:hypothetical protein
MRPETLPPTSTRVERNTRSELNELIRTETDARLARLERGRAVELRARLAALDREWDIERVLQANASTLVVLGTLRFLLLPAAVLTFFAQHALQGWCPPLPILERGRKASYAPSGTARASAASRRSAGRGRQYA